MKEQGDVMCNFVLHYSGTYTDSPLHISEYVYLQANSNQLCATSNFKWNPGARVYLIVASEYSILHLGKRVTQRGEET